MIKWQLKILWIKIVIQSVLYTARRTAILRGNDYMDIVLGLQSMLSTSTNVSIIDAFFSFLIWVETWVPLYLIVEMAEYC